MSPRTRLSLAAWTLAAPLFLPGGALAATIIGPATPSDGKTTSGFYTACGTAVCHGETGFLTSIFNKIVDLLTIVAGFLALYFIVLNGIRYVTSNGDPAKAKAARANVISVVIGIIVIGATYFIIRLGQTAGLTLSKYL